MRHLDGLATRNSDHAIFMKVHVTFGNLEFLGFCFVHHESRNVEFLTCRQRYKIWCDFLPRNKVSFRPEHLHSYPLNSPLFPCIVMLYQ